MLIKLMKKLGFCEDFADACFDGVIIINDVGAFIRFREQGLCLYPIQYCPFCGKKIFSESEIETDDKKVAE